MNLETKIDQIQGPSGRPLAILPRSSVKERGRMVAVTLADELASEPTQPLSSRVGLLVFPRLSVGVQDGKNLAPLLTEPHSL